MTEENMELDGEESYVAEPVRFQNKELWPLTHGSDLMFIQVRTPGEDSVAYEGLAFVFIHLKRGGKTFKEDRAQVSPLCWDIQRFRNSVMDWVEEADISPEDRFQAVKIYREAYEQAAKSEVDPISDTSTAQKKTEAQSPTPQVSSSTSSGKKRGRPRTKSSGNGPSGS